VSYLAQIIIASRINEITTFISECYCVDIRLKYQKKSNSINIQNIRCTKMLPIHRGRRILIHCSNNKKAACYPLNLCILYYASSLTKMFLTCLSLFGKVTSIRTVHSSKQRAQPSLTEPNKPAEQDAKTGLIVFIC
jgi:hypothetical protein